MNTRKRSFVIYPSVSKNIIPSSLRPALLYMICKSVFRSLRPYVDEIIMVVVRYIQMNDDSLDSDYLPEPPTPTSKA